MLETDLSGEWLYKLGDEVIFAAEEYSDEGWETMYIPQNWFLSGLDHHGVVWFRRSFEFYKRYGENFSLRFDGIDYSAQVFLNGDFLGLHEGYFEPFAFDITDVLRNGQNLLAVRVESPFEEVGLDGWYLRKKSIKGVLSHHDCRPGSWGERGQSYNTGGIWNRVKLLSHGDFSIDAVRVSSDLSEKPFRLILDIDVNNHGESKMVQLGLSLTPDNFKSDEQHTYVVERKLLKGKSTNRVAWYVPEIELWQPWDRGFPHLYDVGVEILDEEAKYTTSFGFRSIEVDGDFHWKVNGLKYFPRGSNIIASQWLAETLFSETAIDEKHPFGRPVIEPGLTWFEQDVKLIKDANLNMIRVHAHVLPPEFHLACDRAGVMVWQDFPLQWGYEDSPEFHKKAEEQIRAMVKLLYNHPSVVAWCCHNESPWDSPWMAANAGGTYDPEHNLDLDQRLVEAVKEEDTSRYIHMNSGTGDGHPYPGWYYGQWQDYKYLPGEPFPTEYGAQALPNIESVQRMFGEFGEDAGHSKLVMVKAYLDKERKGNALLGWLKRRGGSVVARLEKKEKWRAIMKMVERVGNRVVQQEKYRVVKKEDLPAELHEAFEAWDAWVFHNFQPQENFEAGRVRLGDSLDEFIANSQAYQSLIIQMGTEFFRRAKYNGINGLIHFMFVEPWPAITWAVVDYWRKPKKGYEALKKVMQPVLPTAILPMALDSGKTYPVELVVVSDVLEMYIGAECSWKVLDSERVVLDEGEVVFDLILDSVSSSRSIKVDLPTVGNFKLHLDLRVEGEQLGWNEYDLVVG